MADPLSIASSVVSLIAVAGRIVDIYVGTFRKLDAAKTSIRKENQHLGLSSTIQYLIPPLYTRIKTLEEDVLSGSDDVLQSFRESHSSYCNMVAIAGAIVAQIAMTSLVLPQLNHTHWITTASFVISLIAGLLTVYFAVMNQGSLSSLYRPEHVRLWLTTPTASLKSVVSAEIQFDRFQVVKRVREIQKAKSRRTHMDVDNGQVESMEDVNDEGRLLNFLSQYLSPSNRTASLSAALLLIMPTLMLNVSVSGLLVALGLYSAFMWTRGLDDGETDWRNIFIFYTVGSGFMLFLYFIPNAMKDLDSAQYTNFKRMKATIEVGRRTTEMQQPVDSEQQLEGDAERATIGLAQSLKMSLEAQERLLDANKDLLRQLQRVNLGLSP